MDCTYENYLFFVGSLGKGMKIISNKIESRTASGSVVLLPTSADDLYVLSSVISEEDTVEAYTTRKLSLDGGRTQQKVTARLMVAKQG